MYKYPKDLISALKDKSNKLQEQDHFKPPQLPSDKVLRNLLDVAYHATFATEEGRRPGFRVINYSLSEHKLANKREAKGGHFLRKNFRIIPFDKPRPYSVAELIRLAPAAELKRLMICVGEEKSELIIWALLDVGENWWKFIHHEASGGMPPPNYLSFTSTGPGEISISTQGNNLVSLNSGRIITPSQKALWNGPLSDFFDDARQQLYKDVVNELKQEKWDEVDDDYPSRYYNFFLERVLFHTRQRNHGGSYIIGPDYLKKSDTRLTDRINIKYPCTYDYVWSLLIKSLVNHQQYYDLYFPLWDGTKRITKSLFQEHSLLTREGDELEEALGDVAQAIASLTSVDGAVVMTKNFKY
jgi:hypothetical protein